MLPKGSTLAARIAIACGVLCARFIRLHGKGKCTVNNLVYRDIAESLHTKCNACRRWVLACRMPIVYGVLKTHSIQMHGKIL